MFFMCLSRELSVESGFEASLARCDTLWRNGETPPDDAALTASAAWPPRIDPGMLYNQ